MKWFREHNTTLLMPLYVFVLLVVAGIFYFSGNLFWSILILQVTLVAFSVPVWIGIVKDLLKKKFGVDIIAGVALVSAFLFAQYLAGVVVLLMLSGGEALEFYAMRRARKELSSLLSGAPLFAHREEGLALVDVPIEKIQKDDVVLVKSREIIPVDGIIIEGVSIVDESAMTGESLPVEKRKGSSVLSGTRNEGGLLKIRVMTPASESRLQQIVQMVKSAEEAKTPFVRMADKASVYFTVITFVIALLAWLISHDPTRILAVLVVATPCPLILATPIAFIGGLSRAAKRGILVKGGSALEGLAGAKSFVFDKTGTITLGMLEVSEVKTFLGSEKEIVHISASLESLSSHILARSILEYAKSKNITSDVAEKFEESFGDGVSGTVDGAKYFFGKLSFLKEKGVVVSDEIKNADETAHKEARVASYLGNEKTVLGAFYFADQIRGEAVELFKEIRKDGIEKIVILTGDKLPVAEKIAKLVGVKEICAECMPDDKLRKVQEIQKHYKPLVMVGDGINDAPALIAADVGIVLSGHSATIASDSADIVIVSTDILRVHEAFEIAKRVVHIAKQGIVIGIGLSIFLMILAMFGFISPLYGALLQELIDVTVILNALRVGFENRV